MRQFLRFLHEKHYSEHDLSVFIPSIRRNRDNKLPATYTDEEVQRLLDSVEKGSAVGRRDYLILLASEYGLRASDIRTLAFKEIDWDLNLIDHKIVKTGKPLQMPLLADVGNAIYDYLSDGRPKSKCQYIVVSHNLETRGKPITSATLHSIVSQHMRLAKIKDWQRKRHGPHALRHSLAVRMLEQNTSTPVISEVLGHRSTATTSIYLKVDAPRLRQCPLQMPPLNSRYYTKEGDHGKI